VVPFQLANAPATGTIPPERFSFDSAFCQVRGCRADAPVLTTVPDDTGSAPVHFLQAVFEPDDWVAVFLKSYVDGRVVQRVASAVWAASDPVQAWLRAMNAHRFNVYVA
jgi:hypothetical protein